MSFDALAVYAVVLLIITSLILLVNQDWRISIGALAVQYIGVFLLVALDWPPEMAAAKIIAGWIAGAVLGMAILSYPDPEAENTEAGRLAFQRKSFLMDSSSSISRPSGSIFRLVAAILVGLTVFSIAPKAADWIQGIQLAQAWGAFILIGMGFLQLGFTAHPFRTVLGLLTALAGFEILYAVVERSTLVAGLLAAVNLGLALVGAYLLVAPSMEETE